ncbi:MAG: GNAT family N-acetyltransferase [Gammaproteobacteria bacterium]|nr:GNAT family N-acetyltransferase [Gammaproteobacteria bacterium]
MRTLVTTHHLELTEPGQLKPAKPSSAAYQLVQAEVPSPELNRFLYASVGADWCWYERLSWPYQRWLDYLNRPEVVTWVAYVQGTPAGYFELESQDGGSEEIAYFGLLPGFIGKGLGGALLTDAINTAWARGARRVWLHTCSLDHPSALDNYQARGFRVFDTVQDYEELPDESLEPWPGAGAVPSA